MIALVGWVSNNHFMKKVHSFYYVLDNHNFSRYFINNTRLIPLYSGSYKNEFYAIKFVFHDTVVRIT